MKPRVEGGAAMLIAIFALLLISVVAIALLVSSGTDTTLAGNYRTSTSAYYAGLAGLEEGRGRLLWRNPDFINNNSLTPNFVPILSSQILASSQLLYILNPINGETVAPWDPTNSYFDHEYKIEYGSDPTQNSINSTFTTATTPGPLYKWIRITPATELSLHLGSTPALLYFDSLNVDNGVLKPSLVTNPIHLTARQAVEVTALAVLPNNTQKMMQYVVAPLDVGLYFHSVLEMPATSIVFAGSNSMTFKIDGLDGSDGTGPLTIPGMSSCTPNASLNAAAVGVTESSGVPVNYNAVVSKIPPPIPPPGPPPMGFDFTTNYIGIVNGVSVTPGVQDNVYVNPALNNVQSLSQMVQKITQNADAVLPAASGGVPGNYSDTDLLKLTQMSATNPMTVVVNGNLTINGTFSGYGLLLVTGDFTTTSNAVMSWKGIVMVVGTGNVILNGSNTYIGNFFVAQIAKPFGTPLTALGTVTFDASNASGTGIYRNSCWINAALLPNSYKILSFREIPIP
jgi:hypothetical protein